MTLLADLPAMDVGARADRVRARLADAGVDALLVTRLPNVRYLTGFTGSAGLVLLGAEAMLLVTDGRYAEQSRAQVEAAGVAADVAVGARTTRAAASSTAAPPARWMIRPTFRRAAASRSTVPIPFLEVVTQGIGVFALALNG